MNRSCNCPKSKPCEHYNLLILFPELCKEWDYKQNNLDPIHFMPGSGKKVWWICLINSCGCHNWIATIGARTRVGKKGNTGCPFCFNKKLCAHNNLLIIYPTLCEEWDYEKNIEPPENFLPHSGKRAWWICSINNNHKWDAIIDNRSSKNRGCPYCYNLRIDNTPSGDNLLSCYPDLCKEWDYEKNNEPPENFAPHTHKKVWWICLLNPCGCHKWIAAIYSRTGNDKAGCPFCSNFQHCEHNNLLVLYPDLCKGWDYILKNINSKKYKFLKYKFLKYKFQKI